MSGDKHTQGKNTRKGDGNDHRREEQYERRKQDHFQRDEIETQEDTRTGKASEKEEKEAEREFHRHHNHYYGKRKAKVLSDDKRGASKRLGKDVVNGFLSQFFLKQSYAQQNGHESATKRHAEKTEVDDHLVSITDRNGSKERRDGNNRHSKGKNRINDFVANGFAKCIRRYRKNLVHD